MDLKKFKTLALVAVAAGLATQPVNATGEQTVAEDNYYVRSCGGEHSCGAGYPKPYNQTNPAPVAMDENDTQMVPPGQAPASKNGMQPAPVQGQKSGSTTSNSRYYQKRDRDVADNAPNFSPSNGLLPDQQKGTGTNSTSKYKNGTGTSSTTNNGTSGTTNRGTSSSSSTSGYGSGSSSTMNSGR